MEDPHAQAIKGSMGKLEAVVVRPGQSAAVWLRARAEKIYETLFLILQARCFDEAAKSDDNNTSQISGYEMNSGFYDNPGGFFMKIVREQPLYFGMHGYQLTARNIETLYLLFLGVYQITKPTKDSCAMLLNANKGGLSSIKYLIDNPAERKNFHEIAFSAARLLALGQIFNTLQYAQRVILNLSSGSYMQNFILRYAQGLLWNVMGTDKFLEAQEEIRNQLTELMKSSEAFLAKNVGKSGRSIRQGVGSNSGASELKATNPH
jgi:hypothetical protein